MLLHTGMRLELTIPPASVHRAPGASFHPTQGRGAQPASAWGRGPIRRHCPRGGEADHRREPGAVPHVAPSVMSDSSQPHGLVHQAPPSMEFSR